MPSPESVTRIAKILARATSDSAAEADTAISMAHKRMIHDGVTMDDLLRLPISELYQATIARLAEKIANERSDLSKDSQRQLYADYLDKIVDKFRGGGRNNESGSHWQASPDEEPSREDYARDFYNRTGKSAGQGTHQEPPREAPKGRGQRAETSTADDRVFTARFGKFNLSFSWSKFVRGMQASFGRGSFVWTALAEPQATARLAGASIMFAMVAVFGVFVLLGVLFAALPFTVPMPNFQFTTVVTHSTAIVSLWRAWWLFNHGWYR